MWLVCSLWLVLTINPLVLLAATTAVFMVEPRTRAYRLLLVLLALLALLTPLFWKWLGVDDAAIVLGLWTITLLGMHMWRGRRPPRLYLFDDPEPPPSLHPYR
jgi:hypothetical protein